MKNYLFCMLMILWLSQGCDAPVQVDEYEIPENAEIYTYPDDPGLKKVMIFKVAGTLFEEGYLRNGRKEGLWTTFHPDGKVATIHNYIDGLKQGLYLVFNESGKNTVRANYENDKLEGDYKKFNFDRLIEEMTYRNGQIEGMVRKYYVNGNILEESPYQDGQRNGVCRWYDQEGNLTIEYTYEHGKLIGQKAPDQDN